jgi:hypothetical protein
MAPTADVNQHDRHGRARLARLTRATNADGSGRDGGQPDRRLVGRAAGFIDRIKEVAK